MAYITSARPRPRKVSSSHREISGAISGPIERESATEREEAAFDVIPGVDLLFQYPSLVPLAFRQDDLVRRLARRLGLEQQHGVQLTASDPLIALALVGVAPERLDSPRLALEENPIADTQCRHHCPVSTPNNEPTASEYADRRPRTPLRILGFCAPQSHRAAVGGAGQRWPTA
jgi:hypothetical protein